METNEVAIEMPGLVNAAMAAAEHSYSPYSGFRVGAAILLSNGHMVTGTNVENVSYGLTICAERAALVRAVSPPCGACRQVLAEFMDGDAPFSFPAGIAGAVESKTLPIRELLPHGFDLQLK